MALDSSAEFFDRIAFHSFGHIIPKENAFATTLSSGPTGKELSFTYANRNDKEMFIELSQVLVNICNVSPGGVVCFFSSYQLLDAFQRNLPYKSRESMERKKKVLCKSLYQVAPSFRCVFVDIYG